MLQKASLWCDVREIVLCTIVERCCNLELNSVRRIFGYRTRSGYTCRFSYAPLTLTLNELCVQRVDVWTNTLLQEVFFSRFLRIVISLHVFVLSSIVTRLQDGRPRSRSCFPSRSSVRMSSGAHRASYSWKDERLWGSGATQPLFLGRTSVSRALGPTQPPIPGGTCVCMMSGADQTSYSSQNRRF